MRTSFGPWATAIHCGTNAQLSTFWRRRLRMLLPTSQSRLRLGPRTTAWLVVLGVLACGLPTFRNAPALAQQGAGTSKSQATVAGQPAEKSSGAVSLLVDAVRAYSAPRGSVATWKYLSDEEADRITVRHLKALALACHVYAEEHNGQLPPPAIPNPALPPEKRLSGLVLLLPYLGKRPSYIDPKEKAWDQWGLADVRTQEAVYNAIHLDKAWDDPANRNFLRTVLPPFVSPRGGPLLNEDGYAVSHFAFVRGALGNEDGAHPEGGKVVFIRPTEDWPKDKVLADGSVNILGLGQIHSDFGPWLAAGPSTSRYVYHPSETPKAPTFGSLHEGACYFATCDAAIHFLDMAGTDPMTLRYLSGRADGHPIHSRKLLWYKTAADWRAVRAK